MNPALAATLQVALLLVVLGLAYVPLGDYMASVYRSERDLGAERVLYRLARIDPKRQQTWVGYALAVLAFSVVSVLFLYLLQRLQGVLPWADGKPGINPATAFNTAVSFVSNTNWQSYSPEQVMSNLTQMIGLAVQNFASAAVGLAVAVALIRGLVNRRGDGQLGNFWVDLVRGVIRILLPLSIIMAVILITQGAVQSFKTGFDFTTLNGASAHGVVGPFASQEAIKELGTNGGGTLSANSAHPFSNPTPLSNIVEIIALLIIPVCLTRTYGTLVGDRRQGYTLLGVMASLWGIMLAVSWYFESRTNGVAAQVAGAMMEGKEQRFGIPASVLFAVSTTGTSTGAVNSAHDSFSAGGGGVLLWNMLLGEVAPGGVGSGLYGILMMAVVTVFVGGLLVGRSPEFLGKKVGQNEITMAALYVLVMPALVLIGAGITVVLSSTLDAQGNGGSPGTAGSIHGFSEVLYAFASAANNNGSAFGGLTVTSDWFQSSLGFAMLLGRFLSIVFVLALAGLLARQRPRGANADGLEPAPGQEVSRIGAGAPRTSTSGQGRGGDAVSAGAPRTSTSGQGAADGDDADADSRGAVALEARTDTASTLPTHGLLFGALLFGTILLVAGLTFFPAMALGPIAEAAL
ncbi:potassium-transporting ATPase subunit KdpA [Gordonia polyisoprenivorans]|uniref:potassium-transporting ATPase subunit KdpA n=1 Tax=Gordonia polyisoprenivorans TaxID=84595 RepID=UPI000B99E7EF|nr:potassium-transporting ATPase subunit KdpA [Gordonia polyisoprenivorans]OZC32340.1 potassium-transporting ATPase subunit KdpA [Gordonia polyisoprenivorans]